MLKRNFIARIFLLLLLGFSVQSCGVKENLEDITDNANQILEQLAQLSRTVNSKVETGQLTDEVGSLIDDRIENLAQTIEDLLVNGGGFLFDEVNGTLDNTFDNVGSLIEDINDEILNGSLPANIQLVSNELMLHTNNISAHAADLINLSFGNTSILLSQATDALMSTIAWVIMGLGLLLIILLLIIFGSKMNKPTRVLVIVLASIFLILPISFLFIPPVKGLVLKSMNVGEEIVARSLQPKIIGLSLPEYEIGTDDKLMAFGVHLDQLSLDSIEIGLYASNKRLIAFSPQSIKVLTANKIVISDFGKSNLNWKRFSYQEFATTYNQKIRKSLPTNYQKFAVKQNIIRMEKKLDLKAMGVRPAVLAPLAAAPQRPALSASQNDNAFKMNVSKVMQSRYTIAEGDYELRVYKKGSDEPVSGVQHISISYPPPPPPKPDVFPISVSWVSGNPTKGESARLQVKLGVINGEEAKNGVEIGLSASPSISGLRNIRVSRSQLRNASANFLILTSAPINLKRAGNFAVSVRADAQSRLTEANENNNQLNKTLRVRDYRFNTTVVFSTFTSHTKFDGGVFSSEDDYRIDISTTVPGHGEWRVDYDRGGEPNNNYPINAQKSFNGLKENAQMMFYTTGHEADSGTRGDNDDMGSGTYRVIIGSQASGTEPILLKAPHYTIRGEVRYNKVVLN